MIDASSSAPTVSVSEPPFPPLLLRDFLRLCDGRWMSLRSTFALESEDHWHQSERGEVELRHQPDSNGSDQLLVRDGQGSPLSSLTFKEDGSLSRGGSASGPERQGAWTMTADGCLELRFSTDDGSQAIDRLWFIKPNLRLRSNTLVDPDGTPRQAGFCSEIRRVSAPGH